MRSHRLFRRGKVYRFFPPRFLLWGGVVLSLFSASCGTDLAGRMPPRTLGDNIIPDPTDGNDDAEDLAPPADPDASQLTFTAGPVFCCSPLSIEFAVQPSATAAARQPTYEWDFGDGRGATGPVVEHTFPWATEYIVVLTARWPDEVSVTTEQVLLLAVDESGATDLTLRPPSDDEPENNPDVPPDEDPDGILPGSGGPVADAGPDRVVNAGDLVVLDGRGSHSTAGGPLTYRWAQFDGPGVELSATDQDVVTFTSPRVGGEPKGLTFELMVTEGGLEALDEVAVTVLAPPSPGDGNNPPSVGEQSVSVVRDIPTALTLEGIDADGDDLTFSIISEPEHGVLGTIDNTAESRATVLYTPPPGYVGPDAFLFQASDGSAVSDVALCRIVILEVNATPRARDTAYLCQEGRPGLLTLAGDDADGDSLVFTVVNGPGHGALAAVNLVAPDSATVVYTPQSGYEGLDTFAFKVSDGTSVSNTATVTLTITKVMLPWIEINVPQANANECFTEADGALPGMTLLDYGLVGLEHWTKITDRAIVTCRFGQVPRLYPELMERKPEGMIIYGGSKPSNLPGFAPYDPEIYNFADAASWVELADLARYTADITGTEVFVLENEGALRPFHEGLAEIDFAQLQVSLAPLRDTGIQIWWNLPIILSDSSAFPDRRARTAEFVVAVAEAVPNSVFFAGYTMWYGWREVPARVEVRDEMIALVALDRMQERLLVTQTGYLSEENPKRCYTLPEALAEMQLLPQGPVNLWPGAANWIHVSEAFANTLPPLAAPVGGD